jgi:SAM-dependent methyltransferase
MDRYQVFDTLVSPLKPGKMLDLGTGHGNFALAATRLGWDVTAVDARTARMPRLEGEKDPNRANLIRSVKWIQQDVRTFAVQEGEYDLICVLGLLHHLEVKDQVDLLERCSGTLTLLTSRVVPDAVDTEGPYKGVLRREPGETREERDQIFHASWGNEVSFRHTEESFLRLVRDCGYSKVMPTMPPHEHNYTFYLCLPPPTS